MLKTYKWLSFSPCCCILILVDIENIYMSLFAHFTFYYHYQ